MILEKEKTCKLLNTIQLLDKKIDLYEMKRELIRQELIKRNPLLENDEEFKPRQKTI